jgi:hypothetical protein
VRDAENDGPKPNFYKGQIIEPSGDQTAVNTDIKETKLISTCNPILASIETINSAISDQIVFSILEQAFKGTQNTLFNLAKVW